MLIESFTKFDTSLWRWPHFSPRELACRCGGRFCRGEYWHDESFLDALEALRADMAAPLVINSGHRCDLWNAWVGGAAHSMHKQIAVDVSLAGHDRFALLHAAVRSDAPERAALLRELRLVALRDPRVRIDPPSTGGPVVTLCTDTTCLEVDDLAALRRTLVQLLGPGSPR